MVLFYLSAIVDLSSSPLEIFKLDKDSLLLNKTFCFIPLVIDVEIAPRKKNPIINHMILSNAMEDEKACPDLIISVIGSNGSKCLMKQLSNYIKLRKNFN